MAQYFGKLKDIPVNNESNFMPNSDKRIVFGPDNGLWNDYVARCFTLHPGAGTEGTAHQHLWNHWIICLAGKGKFELEGENHVFEAGMWICIPSMAPHRIYNDSNEDLTFICIVPPEGDVNPTKK